MTCRFAMDTAGLYIARSNGHVLLHSFDRDNLSDNEVILLDTKNTSTVEDDTSEIIALAGTGIPMNLQLMAAP